MDDQGNDIIASSFMALAGQIILVVLPLVLAVSIGLVVVGLVKRTSTAVIAGIAFPVVAGVAGNAMVASAQANSNGVLASAGILPLLPYTTGFAVVIFVFAIVPGIVRAARRRR